MADSKAMTITINSTPSHPPKLLKLTENKPNKQAQINNVLGKFLFIVFHGIIELGKGQSP